MKRISILCGMVALCCVLSACEKEKPALSGGWETMASQNTEPAETETQPQTEPATEATTEPTAAPEVPTTASTEPTEAPAVHPLVEEEVIFRELDGLTYEYRIPALRYENPECFINEEIQEFLDPRISMALAELDSGNIPDYRRITWEVQDQGRDLSLILHLERTEGVEEIQVHVFDTERENRLSGLEVYDRYVPNLETYHADLCRAVQRAFFEALDPTVSQEVADFWWNETLLNVANASIFVDAEGRTPAVVRGHFGSGKETAQILYPEPRKEMKEAFGLHWNPESQLLRMGDQYDLDGNWALPADVETWNDALFLLTDYGSVLYCDLSQTPHKNMRAPYLLPEPIVRLEPGEYGVWAIGQSDAAYDLSNIALSHRVDYLPDFALGSWEGGNERVGRYRLTIQENMGLSLETDSGVVASGYLTFCGMSARGYVYSYHLYNVGDVAEGQFALCPMAAEMELTALPALVVQPMERTLLTPVN